jgi:Zn-finger nucleic acid-binding protein
MQGVWLDRGELDKIIEKSVQPASSRDELNRLWDQYHNQNDHHKYQHATKEEVFFRGVVRLDVRANLVNGGI